jgi:tetratricopeptide (TPR) repeat protein
MRQSSRFCLVFLMLAAITGTRALAETPADQDAQKPFVPLHPLTQQDLARRKALALYGLGMLRLRQDRLVEATHILEEAVPFDPEAAAIQRALFPLYLALGRNDDALAACKKTLALDPGDFESWALYARQLKGRGQPQEAIKALEQALASSGLAEHLELQLQFQYDRGALCEEVKDYDHCLAAFAEVVRILESPEAGLELEALSDQQLKQQAAATYERMVKIGIQAKQYELALRLFSEGNRKYPVLARRLDYNLAQVYAAQGQPDRAFATLKEYVKSQPPGAEAYELGCALLKQTHRETEILPWLKESSDRDSKNNALRLLLTRQYAAEGHWLEAEKAYTAMAEESPTPELYRGLFAVWNSQPGERGMDYVLGKLNEVIARSVAKKGGHQAGDPQSAAKARAMIMALRQDAGLARALLPAGQQALAQGRALEPQTVLLLAILAQHTHQLPQAELFYRRCVADNDPEREPVVYGGLLRVLWQEHKYDAVIDVCRQGLNKTQAANHPLFHQQLPRALVLAGKLDEALAAADKAAQAADDKNRLFFRLLRLYVLGRAGRVTQAEGEGQKLLAEYTQPSEVRDIRLRLYELYSERNDWPRAEDQLQIILKADPNDALANNDLGYIWADQGRNLEEAERLIRKAIDLAREQSRVAFSAEQEEDGENAAYLDSLGWVLFRRGKLKEAIVWLEKAAELTRGDEDPTIWDHLGEVYFQLQDAAKARTAWRKALVLYQADKRRQSDARRQEIERKLKLVERQTQSRE